ncbi:hypothetical protein [Bacillus sp. EB01]|uniref:hypothetical protein n=1 Tax=Bacillus sp. EB01 TaxID=1347086 RepID=UPI0005C7A5C9|nr:hypothetical protein [Bacillus sp. EB01]
MKFSKYILIIISLAFSVAIFYLAYSTSNVSIAIMRWIVGLGWSGVAIFLFKERKVTRKQKVEKWFLKEMPKGFPRYLIRKGAIGWGIPVGFSTWALTEEIELLILPTGYFFVHMALYMVFGLLIGLFNWQKYLEDSGSMGLVTNNRL